jgi:hypothetical protein
LRGVVKDQKHLRLATKSISGAPKNIFNTKKGLMGFLAFQFYFKKFK